MIPLCWIDFSPLLDRYEKLSELLCDPDVTSDTKKLREYSKEQSDLQEAYDAYNEYKSVMRAAG